MNPRVAIVGVSVLLGVVGVILVTAIPQWRLAANLKKSQNNLRELALFGAHHVKPEETPKTRLADVNKMPTEIPAGTIVLPHTTPAERLSWFALILPVLDQQRQNLAALYAQIDQRQPWQAEPNQRAATTPLVVLLCPENTPKWPEGQPAISCYVGISGIGFDSGGLPADSPHRGAFRYDRPTPFREIKDGLSQTLLMGETNLELGPWLRGGPSTVRGLNPEPSALPLIGGQFGGYFPHVANFALCDGSVRPFTVKTTPGVLLGYATIDGHGSDPLPGE
ncbi:MAG: DUF1559 domain-containing protein [Gemmataceae bacterium]|nr:DUF1559 domain-containing protein [Gemmata sp.]MDW8199440.1 DUF1559 domain-containing protein [Gemmataceae bacterium]